MEEAVITELLPISASADGKLNGHILGCAVVSHRMYYAACLGRLAALETKGSNPPQDWDQCRQACRSNSCAAKVMREEEVLKGKAIYFQKRGFVETAITKGREWISSWTKKSERKPAIKFTPRSALDSLPSLGYADAISAAATEFTPAAPTVAPKAPVQALPGETPLQMARRLMAARKEHA